MHIERSISFRVIAAALLVFLLVFTKTSAVKAQAIETIKYSWTNLPKITEPVFKTDTFNILSYGAVANGFTLNTSSINKTITLCSKHGGGIVVGPGGLWLTGPIEMKSNVNLHLEQNAILLFTTDFDQYPLVEGIYEGRSAARNQSPVYGSNLENIA